LHRLRSVTIVNGSWVLPQLGNISKVASLAHTNVNLFVTIIFPESVDHSRGSLKISCGVCSEISFNISARSIVCVLNRQASSEVVHSRSSNFTPFHSSNLEGLRRPIFRDRVWDWMDHKANMLYSATWEYLTTDQPRVNSVDRRRNWEAHCGLSYLIL
jgi:hypothetical protein